MQPDMSRVHGSVLAVAILKGNTKHSIDDVINAYCVSINTAQAERRAMMLHNAANANGFKWRDIVTFYTRMTGSFL